MEAVIFAYGDSITHGSVDLELGGWANRLKLHFASQEAQDESLDIRFYELGVPGETTEGLIKRFKPETEARLRPDFESVFIFAYGANDAAFLPEENKFAVEADRFKNNLRSAILEAKQYSSKIFLLNITPVVEDITSPMGENKKSRTNEYLEPYNHVIKELADVESLQLIDVNGEYLKRGHESLLSEDGLHPNAKGHEVIFNLLKDPLVAILKSN